MKAATDPSSYIKQTPKTWDGFTKTNEIPSSKSFYDTKQMNEREKRVKKRNMIDELDRWYEKGYLKENLRFHRDTRMRKSKKNMMQFWRKYVVKNPLICKRIFYSM